MSALRKLFVGSCLVRRCSYYIIVKQTNSPSPETQAVAIEAPAADCEVARRGKGTTYAKAAERLGCSVSSVRRLVANGIIEGWLISGTGHGGRPRVSANSVEDYRIRSKITPKSTLVTGTDRSVMRPRVTRRPEYSEAMRRLEVLGIRGGERRQ